MGRHRRHRVLRPSISPKYAEHAKENLDTKEEDLDSGSDKEAYPRESYVGKTRHQKRHMSGSSSQGKAPVSLFLSRSARKRTTRNSNSTTELEIEDDGNQETGRQNLNSDKGRDIGKGKSVSCKIVLKDCKLTNIQIEDPGNEMMDTESSEDEDFDVAQELEKRSTRASNTNVTNKDKDDSASASDEEVNVDRVYDTGESEQSTDGDDDSTCDYRMRGKDYENESFGRRRSSRPHHLKHGSYSSPSTSATASWMVGGGGDAKGYRTSRRPSRSHDSSNDDELEEILPPLQSRARSTRRSNRIRNPDMDNSVEISQSSQRDLRRRALRPVENGPAGRRDDDAEENEGTEENNDTEENEEDETEDVDVDSDQESDDMRMRSSGRELRSRRSSALVPGSKKLIEELSLPVSTRLRDRYKMSLRRSIAENYGTDREPKLGKILRKNNRHKRRHGGRAGRNRSGSSSSSSSTTSDSDDNQVQSPSKKKTKRKFVSGTDNLKGVGLVAKKELKMLMEVQPIAVDPSITFKSVGGLGSFIDKLKEIVLFPLLYHEFYEQRGMSAPRGILLHGPPGTGKTLLARALANECSNINGRKVSFFLRKGADLLNKFVGESERQLRMLFQQAALHQPSIIFFDEIDGLAPVRSAKSDQIHNSIVSSLLAEIDGLQDRGSIIVMGSTNRLDFVDPALRRPGRFDCELPIFLPTRNGRCEILAVHVSKWKDPPQPELLDELADRSIGFNGADLKFLCWQAAMNSLRRTYPQIYGSSQKYLLNYDSIKISRDDWEEGLKSIGPSSQRSLFSTYSPAQPLPIYIRPLLRKGLKTALKFLDEVFPSSSLSLVTESSVKRIVIQSEEVESGLNTFLIPALFHEIEKVGVYVLSWEALNMDGHGGSVEAIVTLKCAEVMKSGTPCVCYLPDFERLCDLLSDAAKEVLIRMINQSLEKPILFLATCEGALSTSCSTSCDLMALFNKRIVRIPRPGGRAVAQFFGPVFDQATRVKKMEVVAREALPELPLAPAESPVKPKLNEEELQALEKQENATFRELRIFLRQILTRLARNKKFEEFTRPVDLEEVPDYLDVIENPCDFEAMMSKLNSNVYCSAKEFLDDIQLIHGNCIAYNPDKSESDKRLRMRAFELKDFAEKLIEDEMDSDFEAECQKIVAARQSRAQTGRNQVAEVDSTMDDSQTPSGSKKKSATTKFRLAKRRRTTSPEDEDLIIDVVGDESLKSQKLLGPPSSEEVGSSLDSGRGSEDSLCKNSSHYIGLFQELLLQTAELCKDLSVVKLIDRRFQLVRLVAKYQAEENKEDLYQDLKAWLIEVNRGHEGDAVDPQRVRIESGKAPNTTQSGVKAPNNALRFSGLEKLQKKRKSTDD